MLTSAPSLLFPQVDLRFFGIETAYLPATSVCHRATERHRLGLLLAASQPASSLRHRGQQRAPLQQKRREEPAGHGLQLADQAGSQLVADLESKDSSPDGIILLPH